MENVNKKWAAEKTKLEENHKATIENKTKEFNLEKNAIIEKNRLELENLATSISREKTTNEEKQKLESDSIIKKLNNEKNNLTEQIKNLQTKINEGTEISKEKEAQIKSLQSTILNIEKIHEETKIEMEICKEESEKKLKNLLIENTKLKSIEAKMTQLMQQKKKLEGVICDLEKSLQDKNGTSQTEEKSINEMKQKIKDLETMSGVHQKELAKTVRLLDR